MSTTEICFELGKLKSLAMVGHRHNCGKGPSPDDCSRLDYLELAIESLAKRIAESGEK